MKKQSLPATFTINSVSVWNAHNILQNVDVQVDEGIISAIKPSVQAPTNVRVLMPAGVDPQVHLRVPGQPQKESALTGLRAALAGGITDLLTMPNTNPILDDPDDLIMARSALMSAEQECGVNVYLSAAITRGQRGLEPVDFGACVAAGAVAFTDDGIGVMSHECMRAAFRASADFGVPILQHAEMMGHGRVLAAGPVQERLGLQPYLAEVEADMVRRDLRILKDYPGARYHVLHVSAAQTLEVIEAGKHSGLPVTCEVSPHHLYLSSDDIVEGRSSFKMNPPLRSTRDRDALRLALATGLIDFVATDHAPHELEVKGPNFKTAAFGTTGLETSLRVLLDLCRVGALSHNRLVDVFAMLPGAFLGLKIPKIDVGQRLRAVLLEDIDVGHEVSTKQLYSTSQNNVFLGTQLPGQVRDVYPGNAYRYTVQT